MTKVQELRAKADHFAARAASAKARKLRNTYLALEQAVRSLAENEEKIDAADPSPAEANGKPCSAC